MKTTTDLNPSVNKTFKRFTQLRSETLIMVISGIAAFVAALSLFMANKAIELANDTKVETQIAEHKLLLQTDSKFEILEQENEHLKELLIAMQDDVKLDTALTIRLQAIVEAR